MRRYYAACESPSSGICYDETTAIVVFASTRERDAFVAGADLLHEDLPSAAERSGARRRAVSAAEARAIAAAIMESTVGGRQSGRQCLAQYGYSRAAMMFATARV